MLLLGLLLPGVGCLNTALAEEPTPTVSFDTIDPFYLVGETVVFSGTGYVVDIQYSVTIYNVDDVEIATSAGTATSEDIPTDIESWDSTEAVPGTYYADLYDVTDPESAVWLATVHFGLWGVDMQPDTATISGGGFFPGIIISISIGQWIDEAWVAVEGYEPPKEETSSDPEGEFSHEWNFADAPMGTYTVILSGIGTSDLDTDDFELTTTIDLTAAGRADLIQQEIDDKILEVQDAVSTGGITDIDGALIAKLSRISDKIQQAIDWLGTSRDKVARNMLNAARNKLKAFINQVNAQSGKHISEEVATGLLEQADHLVELIGDLIGSIDEGQTAQLSLSQTEGKGKGNKGKGNGEGNNGKGNGKGKGKGKPK